MKKIIMCDKVKELKRRINNSGYTQNSKEEMIRLIDDVMGGGLD